MLDDLLAIIQRGAAHAVTEAPAPPRPRLKGVPSEHREVIRWTPDQLKALCDPAAVDAVVELEELPCMIVLAGPRSSGKSTLGSWALAREALRVDALGYSCKAEELAYTARRQYGLTPEVDLAMRAPVVLLDDLGAEWADEQSSGLMRTIIGTRHANRRLCTIVTTGLTRDQRVSRYGEGVAARLTEERRSTVVQFRARKGVER
jgi:DNA replication protein DnaC